MIISIFAALSLYAVYKYGIHHIYTLICLQLTLLVAYKENAISITRTTVVSAIVIIEMISLHKEILYKDFIDMFLIGLFMLIGIKEEYERLKK